MLAGFRSRWITPWRLFLRKILAGVARAGKRYGARKVAAMLAATVAITRSSCLSITRALAPTKPRKPRSPISN